jgi:hypothetical protein
MYRLVLITKSGPWVKREGGVREKENEEERSMRGRFFVKVIWIFK